ncbi:hypothetical protein [Algirhabdus cladophorae]|uniref:hypothetical protein n=1 Tax=Algirhabdus cladophorae TaxID=3377108 RepID=UPI003B84542E
MHRYPIATAALLAEASYTAKKHASVKSKIKDSLDEDDVQAYFLTNGVLLIPGSNSVADYIRYNLRMIGLGKTRYRMSDEIYQPGASGTIWHQGFLAHAKVIYDWMERKNYKANYIIGHSLGAASTQILTKSWGVAGIGFASPRPRKTRGRVKNDGFCLCINRDDDMVCDLPGTFHHMGRVHRCKAKRSVFGPDHAMKHYVKVVEEQQEAGLMTKKWP